MKKRFLLPCLLLFTLSLCACAQAPMPEPSAPPRANAVLLRFAGEEAVVDLYDNAAARDLLTLLPLTLEFDDYNASEKTAALPNGRRLDISDAPAGYDPSAGELGYYAPWGNFVIYHRDFPYASGIVPLGKFRSGVERFTKLAGAVTVAFERVNK